MPLAEAGWSRRLPVLPGQGDDLAASRGTRLLRTDRVMHPATELHVDDEVGERRMSITQRLRETTWPQHQHAQHCELEQSDDK